MRAFDIIKDGSFEIVPEDELRTKLEKSEKSKKPLRIKYGIDPTGSDVHIGHLVPIRKMRQFQDLGHTGVIIIGDFTAQIGDPTGRDTSRPTLSKDRVIQNSKRYMEQLYYVLDKEKTEVHYQSEWFGKMSMKDVLKLMGKFTLAQFMAHETFRIRYEKGLSLGLHELMYPILQAYDSVAIASDVELGATEQKFNLLQGRVMQSYFGLPQQVAIMSPILMGTNGVSKMSKSDNNYIGVLDSAADKFGKTMSIPDDLIVEYFKYATASSAKQIEQIGADIAKGETNPKDIKMELARQITSLYHSPQETKNAEDQFNNIFINRQTPDEIPLFVAKQPMWIVKLLTASNLCNSSSDARRMITQRAVSVDGKKIEDINFVVEENCTIKLGKRKFLKFEVDLV